LTWISLFRHANTREHIYPDVHLGRSVDQ